MRLNDQIYGTNGNSRIPSDLKDEIRNAEKKIKDWDRQIQENLWRMEAKRKDWESENDRLHDRYFSLSLAWSRRRWSYTGTGPEQ